MSSKIMSFSVPKLLNSLKAVIAYSSHHIRLHAGGIKHRKRCPRLSLPCILAPLPDDIHTSLVDKVHDALLLLHTDNDKNSDDSPSGKSANAN
ncbi:hypothetical protein BC628DRAFT_1371564 [Trametes gibbosa]|nr:hypothetical protein BC628DRAFT_1371564 [Trametes gibbosa]